MQQMVNVGAMRPAGQSALIFAEPAPEMWVWDEIVSEMRSGRSLDNVAAQHGCSIETIEKIVAMKGRQGAVGTAPAAVMPERVAGVLPALPASLADRFPVVRLTQIVTALHRDYAAFANGADTPALRSRLAETIKHARRATAVLDREVRQAAERRSLPAHRYPRNALIKTQAEVVAPEQETVPEEFTAMTAPAASSAAPPASPPKRVSTADMERSMSGTLKAVSMESGARPVTRQETLSLKRRDGRTQSVLVERTASRRSMR